MILCAKVTPWNTQATAKVFNESPKRAHRSPKRAHRALLHPKMMPKWNLKWSHFRKSEIFKNLHPVVARA